MLRKPTSTLLAILSLIMTFTNNLQAQNWNLVGPADTNWASVYSATMGDIAVTSNGVPYVAYRLAGFSNSLKIAVRKYNGTTWSYVGADTFTSTAIAFDIEIGKADTPYLAYVNNFNNCYVLKYNGISWLSVSAFTNGNVSSVKLTTDPLTGTMYMAVDYTNTWVVYKLNGTNWVTVGPNVTSPDMDLAINSSGVPYIAYTDGSNGNKITAKKFDGTSWVLVGAAGFSSSPSSETDIKFDKNDVPYIACYDHFSSKKAFVYKFNGSTWVDVGTPQGIVIASSGARNPMLAFRADNTPYLVYGQNSSANILKKFSGVDWIDETPDLSFASSGHIGIAADATGAIYTFRSEERLNYTVRKYANATATYLGDLGITGTWTENTRMATDVNGTPYFAYTDKKNNYKLSVKKFNGSTWVYVGPQFISAASSSVFSITFNSAGEPYVAYKNNDTIHVKKFDGANWTEFGSYAAKNAELAGNMVLDNNNLPYVCYRDNAQSYKPTVRRFDGTNWVTVGTAGFYNAFGTPVIALDKNNVAYVMTTENTRPTILKYNGAAWTVVGQPAFTIDNIESYDITIDTGTVPYILYNEGFSSFYKNKVKKFDGTQWVAVGDTNFSPFYTYGSTLMKLRFDAANVPYAAFGNLFTVMRYKGVSWTEVNWDGPYISQSSNHDYGFDIAKNTGKMFVSYDMRAYFMRSAAIGNLCNEPDSAFVTDIGSHDAIINIKPVAGATGYDYKLMFGTPVASVSTINTIVPFTGLARNHYYTMMIRSRCGADSSGWAKVSFLTGDTCIAAADTLKDITDTSVNLAWNKIYNGQYEYAVTTGSTPPASGTSTTDTVAHAGSLLPNTLYYVYFRTICGGDTLGWIQQTFTTKPVSVKEVYKNGVYLGIYPNPASEKIWVYLQGIDTISGELLLTDLTGKVILQQGITTPKSVMDISGVAKGTYLLKYKDNIHQQVTRMIKN